MILFYSEECNGRVAKLLGSEAIHCRQALRKQVGDEVYVTDGLGQCYSGEIKNIGKKEIEILISEELRINKPREFNIHIGIAPTKNITRFEWFLEKATEFGVDEITPILCARSERKVIKPERLSKIIISASKQSLKCKFPILNPLTKMSDFVQKDIEADCFIAHLEDKSDLLIRAAKLSTATMILIGPEGDFTPEEIAVAKAADYKSVSLGDYRLRTETAGIAAVQQIHFVNQLS